jgi:hypothetical protein
MTRDDDPFDINGALAELRRTIDTLFDTPLGPRRPESERPRAQEPQPDQPAQPERQDDDAARRHGAGSR